jgi:hypothetical protein
VMGDEQVVEGGRGQPVSASSAVRALRTPRIYLGGPSTRLPSRTPVT